MTRFASPDIGAHKAPSSVIASAPGKVNLGLWVGPIESSGYHPLTTVFESVAMREYVEAEAGDDVGSDERVCVQTLVYRLAPSAREPRFDRDLTREFASLDGPANLAARAAQALRPAGVSLRLTIHKTLPVAGGMAGGSADAAAALTAVNHLLELRLTDEDLAERGRHLGADVPACLLGGVSLGLGRGDRMRMIASGTARPTSQSRWWTLVFAEKGLSTPRVFAEFDRLSMAVSGTTEATAPNASSGSTSPMPPALTNPGETIGSRELLGLSRKGTGIAGALHNALAPAAFSLRPELEEIGSRCLAAGATKWMLSGSGPTVAALCETRDQARRVSEELVGAPAVRGTAVTWGPARGVRTHHRLPSWCIDRGEI